jgi:hypothetical protein
VADYAPWPVVAADQPYECAGDILVPCWESLDRFVRAHTGAMPRRGVLASLRHCAHGPTVFRGNSDFNKLVLLATITNKIVYVTPYADVGRRASSRGLNTLCVNDLRPSSRGQPVEAEVGPSLAVCDGVALGRFPDMTHHELVRLPSYKTTHSLSAFLTPVAVQYHVGRKAEQQPAVPLFV